MTDKTRTNKASTVLVFAGLDPTGGAGLQADIETLSSLQVHALPIATCLTVQDTHNVLQVQTIDTAIIQQQIETLLEDIPPNAIKLGLLPNVDITNLISDTIKAQPNIPVIFDPLLRAGGGAELTTNNTGTDKIIDTMREKIIPYSTVITPNSLEARLLTGKQALPDCARALLELGCQHVLITGEHENNPDEINNTFYSQTEKQHTFTFKRLIHQYHGSGCTLASAISAFLVKNNSAKDAVAQAQTYTDATLRKAVKLGQGQYHPNRIENRTDE